MSSCKICNADTTSTKRGRPKLYCSSNCQYIFYHGRPRSSTVKTCQVCFKQFQQLGAGAPRKVCSQKCRKTRDAQLSKARYLKKSYSKTCVMCSSGFQAKAINQNICSEKCRVQRDTRRSRENYYRQHPKGLKQIICSWCNKPVIVPSSFTQKIVSHPQCKEERLRKRQRRKAVGRRGYRAALRSLSIEQLGDRDNWTCHICEQSVNPLLPCNDKQGATVDHVMPLSRGGSDELDNLKLAHWICNVRKSNKLEWKNA